MLMKVDRDELLRAVALVAGVPKSTSDIPILTRRRSESPFDNYGCAILRISNPAMAISIMAWETSIRAS